MKKKQPDHMILAVHITNRMKQVSRVQEILTRYGKNIRTRIGLHEANGRAASPAGVIVLECVSAPRSFAALQKDLDAVQGIETQAIVFGH